jgi:hypothetical protein
MGGTGSIIGLIPVALAAGIVVDVEKKMLGDKPAPKIGNSPFPKIGMQGSPLFKRKE